MFWPPTHVHIGDHTLVLNYVERFFLTPPTRKRKKWCITLIFNSGNEFYITYDDEATARASLQQFRDAYSTKTDWSTLVNKGS